MKKEKAFLRERFIFFQKKIATLGHALRAEETAHQEREESLLSGLFEVLDALENIDESTRKREDELDKPAKRLARNIRSVQKKLIRLLKAHQIVKMEFPDQTADMATCKVVDTEPSDTMQDHAIISIVKHGYIREDTGDVLRKAEVITVLNRSDHPAEAVSLESN